MRTLITLFILIQQTISQNINSVYFVKLTDTEYQCNTTGCSPSVMMTASNLQECQLALLNNQQIRTVIFNNNTNQCEMSVSIPNEYGNLLVSIGSTTMIAFDKSQSSTPSINTTTSTTTTSTSTSTTTTSTSTSTTTVMTPMNPCASGGSLWNKTGITVLSSINAGSVKNVYMDSNDNLYALDVAGCVVRKLVKNATTPIIVAGVYYSGGTGSNQLYFPQDAYVDKKGNLYISDNNNNRIQKYINGSLIGITIAGITGSTGGSALNQLYSPENFVFDDTETYMYIADNNNHRIMRFLTNSTTGMNGVNVAGGSQGITNSTLKDPWGIDYKPSLSSDMFIVNAGSHTVIRWTPGASSGVFVAGTPGFSGSSSTTLSSPVGLKLDNYLNVYVADSNNNRIQMFCANNKTGITIAGTGTSGSGVTQLNQPYGLTFDSDMNLYVADYSNQRVQKFMKL